VALGFVVLAGGDLTVVIVDAASRFARNVEVMATSENAVRQTPKLFPGTENSTFWARRGREKVSAKRIKQKRIRPRKEEFESSRNLDSRFDRISVEGGRKAMLPADGRLDPRIFLCFIRGHRGHHDLVLSHLLRRWPGFSASTVDLAVNRPPAREASKSLPSGLTVCVRATNSSPMALRRLRLPWWACGLLVLCALFPALEAADFPLVRNGDFRLRQSIGPDVRQSWRGGRGTKFEEAAVAGALPSVLMAGDSGAIFQDLELIPGEYELSAGVKVSSVARAIVKVGDSKVEQPATDGWKRVSLRFVCDRSPVRVVLGKGRPAKGAVRFRDVRAKAVKLVSESVPVTDGRALGRIVLPADPDPAEAFAAWELQRFVWRMTGRAPGLDGRDKTFPGRTIYLGRAAKGAAVAGLAGLQEESYLVASDAASLKLAGNSPRGTLYAVYDFLKTQGCGWYLPGQRGEVIPKHEQLDVPQGTRIESPDWKVRGFLMAPSKYPRNMRRVNLVGDDAFDWAVRNRFNAMWHGGKHTDNLGVHRGGSHVAKINHSWGYLARTGGGNQEWWALVKGKRIPLNPTSGRRNQPCTSNPGYRDAVVKIVLKYFEENPDAASYAVSPDDGPGYWCECENCRAQDPDYGEGKWEPGARGEAPMPMTDRALHFVNEVAERVSKVHHDKLIEIYSYQMTGFSPTRSTVHPNVLIKITYRSFSPARHSLADTSIHHNSLVTERMDGFAQAGTKNFGLYDYGSFKNPDCPIFWFFPMVDSLKVLHEKWGFEHYLGETGNSIGPSMMAHNLRALALWDRQIDYRREIQNICQRFYGAAAEKMFDYNLFMHDAMLKWELTEPDPKGRMFAWIGHDYAIAAQYDLPTMKKGQKMLDWAAEKVSDDEALAARIGIAQFGHSLFTLYLAQKADPQTRETIAMAAAAHARVNRHWGVNGNLVRRGTHGRLSRFVPEPLVARTLAKLPLVWSFRTDSPDIGLDENWGSSKDQPGDGWSSIRTDKAWTEQGHDHRGAAWYRVDFSVPSESRPTLRKALKTGRAKLHFGAVDGTADLFLNGRQIGKQKVSPVVMWDKAFVIPLPSNLDVSARHHLVVRVVKKLHGGAGIWKPVSIVAGE
jgi:hypothetical protein